MTKREVLIAAAVLLVAADAPKDPAHWPKSFEQFRLRAKILETRPSEQFSLRAKIFETRSSGLVVCTAKPTLPALEGQPVTISSTSYIKLSKGEVVPVGLSVSAKVKSLGNGKALVDLDIEESDTTDLGKGGVAVFRRSMRNVREVRLGKVTSIPFSKDNTSWVELTVEELAPNAIGLSCVGIQPAFQEEAPGDDLEEFVKQQCR